MSNSLDPDQDRRSVGPDLGPNCLNRLSTDSTSREIVNCHFGCIRFNMSIYGNYQITINCIV